MAEALDSPPAFRRSLLFRAVFLPGALLYVGLVLYWGRFDLERVHREYRWAAGRLAGSFAQEQAGREVAAGCRQATGGETALGYEACLKASVPLVATRAAVISGELARAKHQAGKKLAIFSVLLLAALSLPLALFYGLLLFLRYILTSIRFNRL